MSDKIRKHRRRSKKEVQEELIVLERLRERVKLLQNPPVDAWSESGLVQVLGGDRDATGRPMEASSAARAAMAEMVRFDLILRIARRRIRDADVPTPKGFLIDLLVPPDRAEDMLLGLQKAFEERWKPKHGARWARRMFMMQSVGSVIGFWINWLKKHLDVLRFFAS